MTKSPIKKFRINRKEWLRGEPENSCLLREDGMKCCLGFYSLARGINKKYIESIAEPCDLIRKDDKMMLPELVSKAYTNNQIVNILIRVNDSEKLADKVKEEKIKHQFNKLGVEVEFYG